MHIPLTANQERLVAFREIAKRQGVGLPAAHLHIALRLRGELDVGTLDESVQELIKNHPALRLAIFPNLALSPAERDARLAIFAETGLLTPGLFLQSVTGFKPLPIQPMNCVANDADECLRFMLQANAETPFDGPPLIRASLARVASDEHVLLITTDHAASDGWSNRVIRAEIAALYSQLSTRRGPIPRPSVASFPDFAVWEAQAMRTSYFDEAIAHWREQWSRFGDARLSFDDLSFALQPANANFQFGFLREDFNPDLCWRARTLARQQRVTVHMLFLAAFSVVLRHYTQRNRLAIWGHFANRTVPESQYAVGYFANTNLIGFDLSSNPTFLELLGQVKRTMLAAIRHQDLPLSFLWRALRCYPRFGTRTLSWISELRVLFRRRIRR